MVIWDVQTQVCSSKVKVTFTGQKDILYKAIQVIAFGGNITVINICWKLERISQRKVKSQTTKYLPPAARCEWSQNTPYHKMGL